MTIYKPELVSGDKVPMAITNPKHLVPQGGPFSIGGKLAAGQGSLISEMGNTIGAEAVLGTGSFEDVMLRALDRVSGEQQFSADLTQRAIIEPGSVDVHDITTAQAKANMSLNIARTVLSRVVQGWKDIINTR
ncbi:flagellar hook-basal body complex protein FliE [Treponema primitia ZAS-2]|uniref:Flagellar hook-basal body complex protein FliE n=1 Tax=Treponema primitia (strain ATCC BAA-887 / DSM 12427 / ZAS-2) TaxID=545694 RepID=F5YGL9_TREPZ|nr:flagellar hook-basal body complex protein FliE [Treponema primitia]AEF85105.1 flagellar hook-basal body complex protein FliE [Treponema primitia ZAS-2]